jgi:hypothetical protein
MKNGVEDGVTQCRSFWCFGDEGYGCPRAVKVVSVVDKVALAYRFSLGTSSHLTYPRCFGPR